MRRWLTIALGGLVLSCQGPAVVMARTAAGSETGANFAINEVLRTVPGSAI